MPTPAVISTPYVRGDDRDATGETPPPANRSCGSLLRQWWKESLWPGMGLFGESYLLFSIGTLTPIWKELYPLCFRGEEDAYAQDDTYAQDDAYAYAYEYAHNDGTCSPWLLPSLTYGVVLGVIAGMVLLGYGSDRIGRRKGSILTASLMVAGSLGLVGVSLFGSEDTWTAESVFRGTVASLVVFGIGVGGEYPLSAGLASEQGAATTTHNKNLSNNNNTDHHRGRRVQLVFAMQGLGIWFNSLVMLVLFWILRGQPGYGDNDDNNDGEQHEYEYLYQAHDLVTIWRVTYGIGASVLCFVLVSRILYLEESKVWLEAQESHANTKNQSAAISDATDLTTDLATDHLPSHNSSSSSSSSSNNPTQYHHEQHPDTDSFLPAVDAKTRFRLVHQQYGSRLFGAGTAWLLWDVSFYGNKLFQSTFLEVLVGGDANDTPSPVRLTQAALINATVALTGYYGAAVLIDATVPSSSSGCGCGSDPHLRRRLLGRTQLQTLGFLANGMLFVACGYLVASSGSSSITTVVLYCLSSFVGQLGPNCTTFLIPAEILPTDQRTYGHGVCAAAGKIGALVAAVVFHGMMNAHAHAHNAHQERLFYLSGACSLLAAAATHGFVPESSGLELCELDRQWKLLLQTQTQTQTQQQQQQQTQTQTQQQQQQQQQQEQKLKDECETPFNYDGPASHPDHMSLYERYCQRQNERQKLPTENSPRHLLDGWFA